MKLRISSWTIKQPLIPFVIYISLLFAGMAAYIQLPINNWPDVEIPIINVSIVMVSATPTEIETQITRRLEASLVTVGNVKHLTSTITDGVSSTQIEFKSGVNITQALALVRDKVNEVRPLLPSSAEEPLIQPIDADLSPILTFAVNTPKRSIEEISWFIDNQVINTFLAIKGVSKIQRQGGQEREIQVGLDPARMQAYNLTADTVNTQIRQTTQTLSSGRLDDKTQEIPIKVSGSHTSIELLANLKIALSDERSIQLQDISEVHDTVSEPRQLASFNKQPVVAFAIYRSKSASEVSIESAVNQAIQQLKTNNPDITFTQIQSQVEFTKRNYHSAIMAFIEGTLLAAMMVFVFLRDWRATTIAGLVIPLSVIPTFLIMQWLGFSLNIVSLLALSLVSGILVDDAIVELENIMRHLRLGKTPYQAAIDASDEIGLAIVATSAVVIAVFLPVSFMGGVVGKYFSQFGITIAVATFFSLVVARLITPVLAAYFLKPLEKVMNEPAWVTSYLILLKSSLKNRKRMMCFAGLIFVCTIIIVNWLPTEFMVEEDKSQSILRVALPPGARLADTNSVVTDLTTILLQQPDVKSVYALIGGADSETNIEGEVRQAMLTVRLKPPSERAHNVKFFEQHMLKALSNVPNVKIDFLNENDSKEVTIGLSGDDPVLLQQTAMVIEQQMRSLSQLTNVSSTSLLPRAELIVTPHNDDASRLGVNVDSISNTIRIATMGDLKANLAKLNIGNRQVPIRVSLNSKSKSDPSILSQLLVPSLDDVLIPLSEVAGVVLATGSASITRYDQHRQVMLEADLNKSTLGEALGLIEDLPAIKNLPAGVTIIDTGDAEMLTEMFHSFSTAMFAGIVTIFLVLVLLFRTLFQPATIMLSLPLSICGALLALLLTGYALSLPAIIGILMLMGIVAKNGILLVDFIIENRALGIDLNTSVIEACYQRSRPIMMTSLAMIAGMLPILFGVGSGNAFRTPMAITVIGGLISSTLLSLLFIPVLYLLINDFEKWVSPKLKNLTTL